MPRPEPGPSPAPAIHRVARWTSLSAVASLLMLFLCELTFVDPDMFHEMSLFREMLRLGRVPLSDTFAFTPTVHPMVHHEWGSGAVFYLVSRGLGPAGFMIFKYLLTFAVAGLCYTVARRRGASDAVIAAVTPAVLYGGRYAFTTIRAQLFTLVCLAILLSFLDHDERGRRRWILIWLPVFVAWLNLHGGFVVGAGLFFLHTVEQAANRRPFAHLVGVGAAMAALVVVNPYGWGYIPYLARALSMPRPMIIEWWPVWRAGGPVVTIYAFSLVLLAYAWRERGPRNLPGLLILLATAWAAAHHTRHISLYLVAWVAYVPAWLQETRLGRILDEAWSGSPRLVAGLASCVTVGCLALALPAQPWRLRVPVTLEDERTGRPMYPGGATDYLRESGFEGDLMVPFDAGGFVMWKLHPRVRVSVDGRYEVAYRHGVMEEMEEFYRAGPGWAATLARYPASAVLVPRSSPVGPALERTGRYRRAYRDGAYEIWTSAGSTLPAVDRGEAVVAGVFP